jgi:hypothetical protein
MSSLLSSAALITNQAPVSSDTTTQIERLRAQKRTDEKQLARLQQNTTGNNDKAIQALKKEIADLEKQIEKLRTASTAKNDPTDNAAATDASQEHALMKKAGPAYTIAITDKGYAALQAEQTQKQSDLQ